MQLAPSAPQGSPAWVAGEFIEAYYGVSYTWPYLAYWTELVKPYVTPALYRHFVYQAHADHTAYFARLQREEVLWAPDVQEAAVDTNAPNTPGKRYVMVTFRFDALGPNEPQGGVLIGPVMARQCVVVRSAPKAPWQVASYSAPNAD